MTNSPWFKRVQYGAIGPEDQAGSIELHDDAREILVGTRVIVEGILLVRWHPARVIDGESFRALPEVIIVGGRVVTP